MSVAVEKGRNQSRGIDKLIRKPLTTDSQAARERNSFLAHSKDTAGRLSIVILDGCQVNLVLMPFNKMSCALVHFPGCVGRETASRMQVKRLKPAGAFNKHFCQLKLSSTTVA